MMTCYKKFVGSYPPAGKSFSAISTNSASVSSNVSFTITPFYPPDYLTSVSNVFSGLVYGNGTYQSSASTSGGLSYDAWKAFDSVAGGGWRPSGATTYRNTCNVSYPAFYTSTVTTSNTSGSNFWGEWLQLQFPSATAITSNTLSATTPVPWTYFIVANNGADNTAWTTLYSMSNNVNVQNALSNNTTAYTKYRLVVTQLSNIAATTSATLEVKDWKLFAASQSVTSTRTYTNYTPASYSSSATFTTSDAQYNTGTYSVTMSNWTYLNENASTINTGVVPMSISDTTTYTQADPQGLLNGSWAGSAFTTASNAFLSNVDTTPPAYVFVQYPSPINYPITKYSITASTTPAQAPSKWTLEGSVDGIGSSWVSIDSQSNITSWTSGQTKSYTIADSKYYLYRFTFTRNSSASAAPLSMSRILMFGSGTSTVPMMSLTVNAQTPAYDGHISLSNQQLGSLVLSGGLNVGYSNSTTKATSGDLRVDKDVYLGGNINSVLTVNSNGKVGIGTTNPSNTLAIGANGAAFPTPSGNAPMYACRAWVSFSSTSNATTILGSGNIASVTRNTFSDYTINYTTPMPSANYAVTSGTTTGNGRWLWLYDGTWNNTAGAATITTTSNVRVFYANSAGTAGTVDVPLANLSIFA